MLVTPGQIRDIDEAGLRILEEVGIVLEDDDLRSSLATQGCRVRGTRLHFQRDFVERTLNRVPRSFSLCGRDGSHVVVVGADPRIAINSGVVPRIYDLDTGELRAPTLEDVSTTTRLVDALPRFQVVGATLVDPADVPPMLVTLKAFETVLRNTTKPIIGPGPTNEAEAKAIVALALATRGSQAALAERPLLAPWFPVVSPLTYPANLVAAMRVCAQADLPLGFVTNPLTGLTAPLTLAGALAQMHAELLAGVVLSQQLRPGLPILYEGTATMVDLRRLVAVKGWPESGLILHAVCLLGAYRHLPTIGFGLNCMSKTIDVEYGYQKAVAGLGCALAAPSVLSGSGQFGGGMYASHESLIVDHEILGFLWRVLDGIRVDADSLATQIVQDGDFVVHPHTLAHLRSGEFWRPSLSDTLGLDEWLALGRPGVLSRARDKAKEILREHKAPPFPYATEVAIQAAVREQESLLASHPKS